jgi:hypothetical protein
MGHGSPIVGQLKMNIGNGANGVAPRAAATTTWHSKPDFPRCHRNLSASTQRKKLLTVA